MRSVTWNRFPIKNLVRSLVEWSYLTRDSLSFLELFLLSSRYHYWDRQRARGSAHRLNSCASLVQLEDQQKIYIVAAIMLHRLDPALRRNSNNRVFPTRLGNSAIAATNSALYVANHHATISPQLCSCTSLFPLWRNNRTSRGKFGSSLRWLLILFSVRCSNYQNMRALSANFSLCAAPCFTIKQ